MAVKEGGLSVEKDPCRLGVVPARLHLGESNLALTRWGLGREGGTGSPTGVHGPLVQLRLPLSCHHRCFCFRGVSMARNLDPQERMPIHDGETYLWPERGGYHARRYYIYQPRANMYTG